MQSETHEGRALSYVLVKPAGVEEMAGYRLVVLLHGFGASMYDLAGLASAIDATGYIYAFPNGPYRVNLGMGQSGYSWLVRERVEPPPPDMPPFEELMDVFMAELLERTGTEPGRIVLGGFSQGGGISLHYGLPRPEIFRGIAVLSGFLRNVEELEARLPSPQREQRVFIAHGLYDQTISIDSGGRATKAFLENQGYAVVYNEYDMGHEISRAEVRDLNAWLHEMLSPAEDTVDSSPSPSREKGTEG
jgi:phospholipase/carboxylesterase